MRIPTILIIAVLLCTVSFFKTVNGNSREPDVCHILSYVDELIEEKPDSALIWIDKGIKQAELSEDDYHKAILYLRKGKTIERVNPDKALDYFFKAMRIMEALDNPRGIVSAYTHIASATSISSNEKRLEIFRKALKVAEKTGILQDIGMVYMNIGGALLSGGNPDSGMVYFQKSLKIADSIQDTNTTVRALWYIAEFYIRKGQYDSAQTFLTRALKHASSLHSLFTSIWIRHSLIEVYFHLGQPDSALYQYELIKDHLHIKPEVQLYTYHLLALHFKQTGEYEKALFYRENADSIKIALEEKSNKNMLLMLEMEYASQVREAEVAQLNAELGKANVIRLALIALLLAAFGLIYQQRQKNRKTKEAILLKKRNIETRQELLESELRNSEIQKQYLSDELKYTNKELISFATNITQSQTLINDLKKQIGDISSEKDGKKMKVRLREMRVMLSQTFNNDKQRQEFMRKSRQINHSLVFYLKTNYPQLTEGDINLLILLLLKFSSKEIAALYNIELVSAKKRRYRIRKKLGLETEQSWEEFFDDVMAAVVRQAHQPGDKLTNRETSIPIRRQALLSEDRLTNRTGSVAG